MSDEICRKKMTDCWSMNIYQKVTSVIFCDYARNNSSKSMVLLIWRWQNVHDQRSTSKTSLLTICLMLAFIRAVSKSLQYSILVVDHPGKASSEPGQVLETLSQNRRDIMTCDRHMYRDHRVLWFFIPIPFAKSLLLCYKTSYHAWWFRMVVQIKTSQIPCLFPRKLMIFDGYQPQIWLCIGMISRY